MKEDNINIRESLNLGTKWISLLKLEALSADTIVFKICLYGYTLDLSHLLYTHNVFYSVETASSATTFNIGQSISKQI